MPGGKTWSFLETLTAVRVAADVCSDEENGTDFKKDELQRMALSAFKSRVDDLLKDTPTGLDNVSIDWLKACKSSEAAGENHNGCDRTGRSILDRAKDMRRVFARDILPA